MIGIGMIDHELDGLDIDIVAHHISGEDMASGIKDDAAWSIDYLILNVLCIGLLCKILCPDDLPVVEPAQQAQHSQTNEQKDEHLSMASPSQFSVHLVLLMFRRLCAWLYSQGKSC